MCYYSSFQVHGNFILCESVEIPTNKELVLYQAVITSILSSLPCGIENGEVDLRLNFVGTNS
jgi:hypothetical protein